MKAKEVQHATGHTHGINMPTDVAVLLKSACADCHSNETTYPWYTSVEPISWMIKRHINGARGNFNMSEWQSYDLSKQNHKILSLNCI